MIRLSAYQYLYGSMTASESIRGQVGYQTVFPAPEGLNQLQIQELESRLTYYPTTDSPTKWICCHLAPDLLVLGRIVRLPRPDRHGRLESLAHCLVFPPAEQPNALRHLFRILAEFPFLQDVSQALAAGNRQTGCLPAVGVEISEADPLSPDPSAMWPVEELRRLAYLAVRTQRLAQQHLALALVGPPEAILQTLQTVASLLPLALRQACTFDTHFIDDKGNPLNMVSNYYWATGFPEAPASSEFIIVDIRQKRVLDTVQWRPGSVFETWLVSALGRLADGSLMGEKEVVWAVSQQVEGIPGPAESLTRLDPVFAADLLRQSPEATRRGLVQAIAKWLPLPLAERVADYLLRTAGSDQSWQILISVSPPPALFEWLYRAYLNGGFHPPNSEEIASLGQLPTERLPGHLVALRCLWTGAVDGFNNAVRNLPTNDYRQMLQSALAGDYPEPLGWLASSRAREFLEVYRETGYRPVILLSELVDRLLAIQPAMLVEILPLLATQTIESLGLIRRSMAGRSDIPEQFRAAFERHWSQALARVHPMKRWLHRLRN